MRLEAQLEAEAATTILQVVGVDVGTDVHDDDLEQPSPPPLQPDQFPS